APDPRGADGESPVADPAPPDRHRAEGDAVELRPGDRHPAELEPPLPLPRHAVLAPLRRRDRPEHVPHAARPVPDRGEVAEPVVVPAELAVGGGPEADPARPG